MRLWRARVELPDEPGALARLAAAVAAADTNVVGLDVHTVPGGGTVVDELALSTPRSLTEAELRTALHRPGTRDVRLAPADAHGLVDPATRALQLAAVVAGDPAALPDALAQLLQADAVAVHGLAAPSASSGAYRLRVVTPWRTAVVLQRRWAPFTATESARAGALVRLAATLTGALPAPRPSPGMSRQEVG